MKIIRVTYFALATLLSAVSCSKETAEPTVIDWTDGEIHFRPSLSDVASTRAQDMTLDRLESFQVTCFNADVRKSDDKGIVMPHFENAAFIRYISNYEISYIPAPGEEDCEWAGAYDRLRFFAFSPSCGEMATSNPLVDSSNRESCFTLSNSSKETGSSLAIDYRLNRLMIDPDISRQYDFVTADAEARWRDHYIEPVELNFRHQMSRIELRAWGASSLYDCEIAGVRIGNQLTEGDFVFCSSDDQTPYGRWEIDRNVRKDKVEYTYRGIGNSLQGGTPQAGDKVYKIGGTQHTSSQDAESIMGKGGCAMVLPIVNDKWDGADDPNIGNTSYSTDKMYFSVLLRITDKKGNLLYPYNDGYSHPMEKIYYAVDNAGMIQTRLYRESSTGQYYSDASFNNRYEQPSGIEIRQYGWAAVPVDAAWIAGNEYIYTLDYTEGVGIHDPRDSKPGTPILSGEIGVSVSVKPWQSPSSATTVTVPAK